ncbi:hypothetical protein [Pseudonocardia sp.]|uniref:hypothetical protein n=1 Tax=Pseudonocardia sp. TaxID=60912 RepID=UPI003D0FBF6E
MTVELAAEARHEPILVEFADRVGLGFKLLNKARRSEVSILQDAAASLLSAVGQPKLDTGTLPVHGLMYVSVARRRYWCFHVQGRRGPFGAAGTCQFVFADAASWPPGELWRWCVQRCADGPFRAGVQQREAPSGGNSVLAQRVLRELTTGRARISLAIDPETASALLTGLLQVLPLDVVARYWWRTCLLEPPTRSEQPVVAGRWPDVLRKRRGDQAKRVDEWLGSSSPSLTPAQEKAMVWLADFVSEPTADFATPSTVRGMGGLLDWLATEKLRLTIDRVAGLLDADDPDGRLVGDVPLVTLWAQRQPTAARMYLLAGSGGADVQKALFEGLWTTAVTNHVDELHVPPAKSTAEWRERLAAAMRARRNDDVAAIAGDLAQLQQVGLAPTTDEGLAAARAWLMDLGLTAATHPEFFPDTLDDVRARLAANRSLSAQDRKWLLARGDRLPADLGELAPHTQEPWPKAAMELVGVLIEAGRRDDIGGLAEALMDTEMTSLERFAALVESVTLFGDDVRRTVLRHGLQPVAARRSELVLPDELERECIAAFTYDAAAPAHVRYLLQRAEGRVKALAAQAQELGSQAEAQEPDGRLQQSESQAQESEAQVEKLPAEVQELTAPRDEQSPDDVKGEPPWPTRSERTADPVGVAQPKLVRRRQRVALAVLLVFALLVGMLAGAILWPYVTGDEATEPPPSPTPTSTVDPSVSAPPTPATPTPMTTPPTSGPSSGPQQVSPSPSTAPGG